MPMVTDDGKKTNSSYEKLCEYEKSNNGVESKKTMPYDSVKVKKKPSKRRARCFDLVSYIPIKELDSFLYNNCGSWLQHYAYVHHDKDRKKLDNGEIVPKEKHTHILLYTLDAKTSSAVSKIFDRFAFSLCGDGERLEKTRAIYCEDALSAWHYMLHTYESDPLQYKYDKCCRMTDNNVYWDKFEKTQGQNDSNSNIALAMIDDYIAGFTDYELTQRYGYAYLNKYKAVTAIGNRRCIETGQPIPRVNCGSDRVSEEMVRLFIEQSHFNQREQNIFYMVWSYIQKECFSHYGKAMDFYLTDKEN